MANDLIEVPRLLNLYIDGAGKGNADKLNEAFHSSARWYGTMAGTEYELDKKVSLTSWLVRPEMLAI